MQYIKIFSIFAFLLLLHGCAEVAPSAYQGWSPQQLTSDSSMQTCSEIQVLPMPAGSLLALEIELFEQGYYLCGVSAPQIGGKVKVMQQARSLGACLVYFDEHPTQFEAYYALKQSPTSYGILYTTEADGKELESGMIILALRQDGPAAQAGLRPGDLILSINDQIPTGERVSLTPYLRYGQTNSLQINRQGQHLTLEMPLPAL